MQIYATVDGRIFATAAGIKAFAGVATSAPGVVSAYRRQKDFIRTRARNQITHMQINFTPRPNTWISGTSAYSSYEVIRAFWHRLLFTRGFGLERWNDMRITLGFDWKPALLFRPYSWDLNFHVNIFEFEFFFFTAQSTFTHK